MNTKTKSAEGKDLNESGTNYDKDAYEKASHTVDIAILRVHKNELQILLGKRSHPPYRNTWVLPGGFVDIAKKETLESAAYRELKEETQVTGIPIRQFKTYGDPKRDPRMRIITTVYYAIVSNELLEVTKIKASDDIWDTEWFDVRDLPKLGFDHKKIISELITQVEHDTLNDPISFEFTNKVFTWSDLQDVYETVLNKDLVASNFRRKIKSMYKIKEMTKKDESSGGRPPVFLKFYGTNSNF